MPDPIHAAFDRTKRPTINLATSPVRLDHKAVLGDPYLRSVANGVLARVKHTVAAAAAGAASSAPSSLDDVAREFATSRRTDVRERLEKRSVALLKATPELPDVAKPNDDRFAVALAKITEAELRRALPASVMKKAKGGVKIGKAGSLQVLKQLAEAAEAKDVADGAKFRKLGLYIKEVVCEVETDEPSDSDEIALGGVAIAPDGASRIIPEFLVSDDFDAGEHILYPPVMLTPEVVADIAKTQAAIDAAWAQPGHLFADWDLRTDIGWPTTYTAILAMGEKDDGGFWKFLKAMLGEVVRLVEEALGKSIGAAVGAAVGGAIGNVAGAVVGAIIGFVIGAILDWALAENPDDVVGAATVSIGFAAATRSYYEGAGVSKQPHPDVFPMDIYGDGGHYRINAYLQVTE